MLFVSHVKTLNLGHPNYFFQIQLVTSVPFPISDVIIIPCPSFLVIFPAQIKSDSRRSFICPSVIPGITFFKNPWQILLPDADSLIRDHKFTGIVGFIPVYLYCNRAIFAAVLNRIGQNLLHNKFQPLFIRGAPSPGIPLVRQSFYESNQRKPPVAVRTT